MPRKISITNWIGRLDASEEAVQKFKSQCPPSDCVRSVVVGNDAEEHPIAMGFGCLGAASFTPSPIPGATNIMYKDKLTWVAIYEDGTTYNQYQDNIERSSESISRNNLRRFCLQMKKDHRIIFMLELKPGWKFFYRRRTAMTQGGKVSVMHIVGWQIPDDEFQIAFVYEEDLSVVIGGFESGKPVPILGRSFLWRHPIEFVEADGAIIT